MIDECGVDWDKIAEAAHNYTSEELEKIDWLAELAPLKLQEDDASELARRILKFIKHIKI
ncbi:hypothetical protein FACS1894217_10660 [Clostridia bacterium]|nr:hypothetical protein FACS1894217_10660 [Clostridia bacterium]